MSCPDPTRRAPLSSTGAMDAKRREPWLPDRCPLQGRADPGQWSKKQQAVRRRSRAMFIHRVNYNAVPGEARGQKFRRSGVSQPASRHAPARSSAAASASAPPPSACAIGIDHRRRRGQRHVGAAIGRRARSTGGSCARARTGRWPAWTTARKIGNPDRADRLHGECGQRRPGRGADAEGQHQGAAGADHLLRSSGSRWCGRRRAHRAAATGRRPGRSRETACSWAAAAAARAAARPGR